MSPNENDQRGAPTQMERRFRKLHARPTRVFITISTLLIAVTLFFLIINSSNTTAPGEIIENVGSYRSPSGKYRIEIRKTDAETIEISKLTTSWRYHVVPVRSRSNVATFSPKRDWFLCFDQYDRLWFYHGIWDRSWGMPADSRSYGAAVHLEGFRSLQNNSFIGGAFVVSEIGGWEGVPEAFFDRLPANGDAAWGKQSPLPEAPPEYTSKQLKEIARKLNRKGTYSY